MWVGNEDEAPRVPEQGSADWLRGARIVGVLGVFYRPEGRMGEPEAVEFLLADGQSLLLTCASDGTLHVGPGAWPRLPGWCVPSGQWEFAAVPNLPQPPTAAGPSPAPRSAGTGGARCTRPSSAARADASWSPAATPWPSASPAATGAPRRPRERSPGPGHGRVAIRAVIILCPTGCVKPVGGHGDANRRAVLAPQSDESGE